MAGVFQNIDPPSPLPPGECVPPPPPPLVLGEDTLARRRGGSIFWKTTLDTVCKYFVHGVPRQPIEGVWRRGRLEEICCSLQVLLTCFTMARLTETFAKTDNCTLCRSALLELQTATVGTGNNRTPLAQVRQTSSTKLNLLPVPWV